MNTKKRLGSIPKGLSWLNAKKSDQKIKKKNTAETNASINSSKASPSTTSQKGLAHGWTRATFIIKQEHCDKLKALAYWDRKTVKELVDEAVVHYLKNKRVKPMPTQ